MYAQKNIILLNFSEFNKTQFYKSTNPTFFLRMTISHIIWVKFHWIRNLKRWNSLGGGWWIEWGKENSSELKKEKEKSMKKGREKNERIRQKLSDTKQKKRERKIIEIYKITLNYWWTELTFNSKLSDKKAMSRIRGTHYNASLQKVTNDESSNCWIQVSYC